MVLSRNNDNQAERSDKTVQKRCKILTCKALAHVLESMVQNDFDIKVMDIALHIDPQKLKQRLMEEIAGLESRGVHILLGYGLCGRALEGVVSTRSTLVLPRVDDCVGALLGSRRRHQELLRQQAGCYFLEDHWLETELNIFSESLKGLENIPAEKRDKIAQMALKNYSTLALLDSGETDDSAILRCKAYATQYDLNYIRLQTDLGLLSRLLRGPWRKEEFLVCRPGKAVPFF